MSEGDGVCDRPLLDRTRRVLSWDEQTIAQRLHPDFNRYFRFLREEPDAFDRYLEEVRYLARVGHLRGRVLDLAAGFGLSAICLRILGADAVVCVDCVETKIETARKLASLVQEDAVTFHLGDAASVPVSNESIDAVLIKDAASHFRHPADVYAEVARVLKRGGRLTIVDDRNARNRHVQRDTQKLWEMSEEGTAEELATLGMDESFMQMRFEHIASRFPGISVEQATSIARTTRGHTFEMLDEVVPRVLAGESVRNRTDATCINPRNGIVQERLIDPMELTRQLDQLGFRGRLALPYAWDPQVARNSDGSLRSLLRHRLVELLWLSETARGWLIGRIWNFVVVAVKQ
jgi:SAM-dependent methyltransferase